RAQPSGGDEGEGEKQGEGDQDEREDFPEEPVVRHPWRLLACHQPSRRSTGIVAAPGEGALRRAVQEATGAWLSVIIRSCRTGTTSWVSTRAQKARSSFIPAASTIRPAAMEAKSFSSGGNSRASASAASAP